MISFDSCLELLIIKVDGITMTKMTSKSKLHLNSSVFFIYYLFLFIFTASMSHQSEVDPVIQLAPFGPEKDKKLP